MKSFLSLLFILFATLCVNADSTLYERGKELFEVKDYDKALKAFVLAANTGDLDAMTAVGIMYIGGWGVEQSDQLGLEYITKAAKQSHPKAQYSLGAIYYLGVGVPVDFDKAFSWLIQRLGTIWVETLRNVPLLVQII